MERAVDVVIVGAGTAGSYLAWRLGQAGHSVFVVEKQAQGQPGRHIGIFHMDEIRFTQFGIPRPRGEELIGHYPTGLAWPPDGNKVKLVRYGFYVMQMPLFIERMQGYAREAGAEILFETTFQELILQEGAVAGIRAIKDGQMLAIRSRIVIDASGVDSVVRTHLPAGMGVETDPIAPRDFLYVVLQYWDDIQGDLPRGLNFFPYQKAFINPSYGAGAIVGIGQPESLENAERQHQAFIAERLAQVKHRLVRQTWGRTPYRRPPFSLVADGCMIAGDAAFMTKPFSGEGVTSGFTACRIAAEVAHAALTARDTSRTALWPYNTRYFRDQGAKFAGLFAQLPAASRLSRKDVNQLFEADIIFSSAELEQMNEFYEVRMDPVRMLILAGRLLRGVARGRLSLAGLGLLVRATHTADLVRKHYESFPHDPSGFPVWEAKARILWSE